MRCILPANMCIDVGNSLTKTSLEYGHNMYSDQQRGARDDSYKGLLACLWILQGDLAFTY